MATIVDETKNGCSIILKNEGHTMGNLLRATLAEYEDTAFVGYKIEEDHLRIQLLSKKENVRDLIKGALEELSEILTSLE